MTARARLALNLQKRVLNPILRRALLVGIPIPGLALLETIGRISGQPRHIPVTDGLDGDTFWIVSEQGTNAHYVRNIAANPRVRVKVHGRWRAGMAHVSHEPPSTALNKLRSTLNATIVRAIADDPIVLRIDLDP